MKIHIAQIEVQPGQPRLNALKMLDIIQAAKAQKVDLLIFSELVIPGYLLGDEWDRLDFLVDCQKQGEKIKESSQNITIVFGNVAIDSTKLNEDGRIRKYNSIFIAENGEFITPLNFPYPFYIKSLFPNYREFDDSRYFYSLEKLALENHKRPEDYTSCFQSKWGKIAGILCEDGWDNDYDHKPLLFLQKQSPDLIINISCSPFTLNKNNKRNRVFQKHAQTCQCPLIYVNNVGIQNNGKTIYTFDGNSTIYYPNGHQKSFGSPFEEMVAEASLTNTSKTQTNNLINDNEIEHVYQSILYGTKKFTEQLGIKKIVIGVSGGIDSALNAALFSQFIAPKNLLLVNMPSQFNSQTTKNLAKDLASNLKCLYTEISIQKSFEHTVKQLDTLQVSTVDRSYTETIQVNNFVKENIQARDRSGRILAALAAAFGGAFTSNANKTETTVGYSTLYGDHAGYIANLADLWKFQVYDLARYMNQIIFQKNVIPLKTFEIPPSAELSDQQNIDEGKGDPIIYEYHDQLFRSWVENWNRATPETILLWLKNGELETKLSLKKPLKTYFKSSLSLIEDLEKWWSLYQGMAVAKRIQAPPILAISRRAFGFDHRESQKKIYYTDEYLKLKEYILTSNELFFT